MVVPKVALVLLVVLPRHHVVPIRIPATHATATKADAAPAGPAGAPAARAAATPDTRHL